MMIRGTLDLCPLWPNAHRISPEVSPFVVSPSAVLVRVLQLPNGEVSTQLARDQGPRTTDHHHARHFPRFDSRCVGVGAGDGGGVVWLEVRRIL